MKCNQLCPMSARIRLNVGVAVAVTNFTADRRFRSGSNEAFVTGPAELTLAPCPPHPLPVQVTLRFDGFAV
jgi:hypothetical protein